MMRIPDDKFRVFLSHKHEDHDIAVAIRDRLEKLAVGTIDCFVSGEDISAGSDWNRTIKAELARSHLLLLLFTKPSRNWDWCLYEAGLFSRFDAETVHSVVSLYDPRTGPPRPLSSIQGVAADEHHVERLLRRLCHATWEVSDDWRRGALAPDASERKLKRYAAQIVQHFAVARDVDRDVHHSCHRVVLDFSQVKGNVGDQIPEDAVVVKGYGATDGFTLSLFGAAKGPETLTWHDLLSAVDGHEQLWRRQLDETFARALHKELFPPVAGMLRAWDPDERRSRLYRPILYRVLRSRADKAAPIGATVIFHREASAGDRTLDVVRVNAGIEQAIERATCSLTSGACDSLALAEIRDAFLVADASGTFEPENLKAVYQEDFDASGVLVKRWQATRRNLEEALSEASAEKLEPLLADMRDLNREFSITATERYLKELRTRKQGP